MSNQNNPSLNPVFSGRLRQFGRGTPFIHAPVRQIRISQSKANTTKIKVNRVVSTATPASARLGRSQVLQRNITAAPKAKKYKIKKLRSQKILMTMATFIFIAGISVTLLGLKTNKEVKGQVREAVAKVQQSANGNQDPVSEEAPSASAVRNYTVDKTLPRYIRIPKLSVNARVKKQGVDKTGALKAPGNVHDAGWYEDSSKPGQGGAMLLDGHVAGPTVRGVFYAINKLKAGDLLEVERGDGQKFSYKVVSTKTAKVADIDMSNMLLPAETGKSGLNLITCTGNYDHKSGEYDSRAMVFAIQI